MNIGIFACMNFHIFKEKTIREDSNCRRKYCPPCLCFDHNNSAVFSLILLSAEIIYSAKIMFKVGGKGGG